MRKYLLLGMGMDIRFVVAANIFKRARATVRMNRPAHGPAKTDQRVVHGDPVLAGDNPLECLFDIFWPCILGSDAEALRNAEDMGIYGYSRLAEGVCKDNVCTLPANSWDANEILEAVRNGSAELLKDKTGCLNDRPRLVAVEAHWIDQALDLLWIRTCKILRTGKVGEEAVICRVGRLVPCPLGENAADEHAERITAHVVGHLLPPVFVNDPPDYRPPLHGGRWNDVF